MSRATGLPAWISPGRSPNTWIFRLRVQPNSSVSSVLKANAPLSSNPASETESVALPWRLRSPARENLANEELVRELSSALRIGKSSLKVTKGLKSKDKEVTCTDVPVERLLKHLCDSDGRRSDFEL